MYSLTENYLFTSSVVTSIVFKKSDEYSSYVDPNTRSMVVEYTEGTRYSDILINNFESISDNEIIDEVTKLRTSKTIINGVEYLVNNNVNFISCYIMHGDIVKIKDQDDELIRIPSFVFEKNKSITIVLNSRDILNWNIADYINFLNSYPALFRCSIIDPDNFKITNFESVDLSYNFHGNFNKDYEYYDEKFYLNEAKITSQFAMFMAKEFQQYTICGGISDLTNQQQKTRVLVYNAKLFDVDGEIATHIRKHPKYGRIRTGRILVNWEFVTDDFKEYVIFRDKLLLNEGIFKVTNFQLDEEYSEWWYSVNWITDVGNDIERSPSTKLLSDTLLYTIPFSCELYGWIALENKDIQSILYPITRLYTDNWLLVGSLFNKNDPNVKSYILISNESKDKVLLTETDEGSISADNLERELTTNIDDFKVIIEDEVINPLDFDHGTSVLIIDPKVRKVELDVHDLVSVDKFNGVSRLAFNLHKYRKIKS